MLDQPPMVVPIVMLDLEQELTVEPVTRSVVQGDDNLKRCVV